MAQNNFEKYLEDIGKANRLPEWDYLNDTNISCILFDPYGGEN